MKKLKTIRGQTDEDYEKEKQSIETINEINKTAPKYIGVSLDKRMPLNTRRFRVFIKCKSTQYRLGSFYTEEDAAITYDIKAIELFGENVKRNFPELTMEELKEKLAAINVDTYDIKSRSMQGTYKNIEKTSQYIGVYYGESNWTKKNWVSEITRCGKRYVLGNFHTEEEAAYAYDRKAIELYGEKAKLNFPDLTIEELNEKLAHIKPRNRVVLPKSSKYFGVSLNRKASVYAKAWMSYIYYESKRQVIGYFYTEEEAARAHDIKAIELFGEDAIINFPELTMEELAEKLTTNEEEIKMSSYDNTSRNKQGKSSRIDKTSQYIGVSHDNANWTKKHWVTYITRNGTRYRLGSFYTEEEAACEYDKKAIELYGEEAKVNFPDLTMEEITKNLDKIKAESEVYDPSKKNQGKRLNVSKTSKYVGVCFDKRVSLNGKKWLSYIHFQGKRYHLGNYYTEEEAAKAYDKKAIELYGEGAKLNLPQLSAD